MKKKVVTLSRQEQIRRHSREIARLEKKLGFYSTRGTTTAFTADGGQPTLAKDIRKLGGEEDV